MIPNKDPKLAEQLSKIWRASAERLTKQQATEERIGYIDLTRFAVQLDALKLISEERAKELRVAAFEFKNRTLAVAALDPKNPNIKTVIDELATQGITTKLFIVSQASLDYAWSFYQFVTKTVSKPVSRVDIQPEKVLELEKQLTSVSKVEQEIKRLLVGELTPGALLEATLAGALTNQASDIHFEPGEQAVRLRYRIDGSLRDVASTISPELYKLIISRIKLLANLRLNITNVAQDGRFTLGLGAVQIELRVSTIPAEFGETIVMRVLDPRTIQLSISDLGMRADDRLIVEEQLKEPNGMILNTGPTGSGKTTTLYAFLRSVSNPENKIITIEDPIEYHLPGIEQTQIDARSGYTFSNGLQAIMRQDPDVILVGEIRDKDTAEIAIQAALTGHLVFSTLHTNSAAGVIPRLLDLGAPQTSIGPALNLIIAQRLVRKLCSFCRVAKPATAEMEKKIKAFIEKLPERAKPHVAKKIELYSTGKTGAQTGCEHCHFSGYKGRVGIFELLEVGEQIESLIDSHAGEGAILKFAIEHGLVTLQQDGVLKALAGLTDFTEIESVTGPIKELA